VRWDYNERFSDEPQCGTRARPHPEERAGWSGPAKPNGRARVSKDEDEPLRGALMLRDASRRTSAVEAPSLAMHLSMRARVRGAIWRNEAKDHLAVRVVPAKAGTHGNRRRLWVPALAALGRDDDRLVRANGQPAAVRNDRRGRFIVSDCYLQ